MATNRTMQRTLSRIAREALYLPTLQAASLDSVDCREHCVDAIREALELAYLAGYFAREKELSNANPEGAGHGRS